MDDRLKTTLESLNTNVSLLNSEIRRFHGTSPRLSAESLRLLQQLQESYVRGLQEIERLTRG
jgi:hypothetical protein